MATPRGKEAVPPEINGTSSRSVPVTATSSSTRYSHYLPTPLERVILALFPALLVFGTLFSVISPQTRSSYYDFASQSHNQDAPAPSYFARKSNIFNIIFVKRGWAWITVAFFTFLFTHPSTGTPGFVLTPRRIQSTVRWAAVTGFWILVTQWCFGAPIIDRGFRWTGGRCELAEREVYMGDLSVGEMVTAVACKAGGGKWKGGHDISGHVFLLALGTTFLIQEVGWPLMRWTGWFNEERRVLMSDGAVKGVNVESQTPVGDGIGKPALGFGGKFAVSVVGLSLWMLLMTAIYFHTWFEKFTGLLTAGIAFYAVYIVPRFVPPLRAVMGVPGI